jgi:hypothetical protein
VVLASSDSDGFIIIQDSSIDEVADCMDTRSTSDDMDACVFTAKRVSFVSVFS